MSTNSILEYQTTIISNSIKEILEFSLNRDMRLKCFELMKVNNTYDFSKELKSKLIQLGSHQSNFIEESVNQITELCCGNETQDLEIGCQSGSSGQSSNGNTQNSMLETQNSLFNIQMSQNSNQILNNEINSQAKSTLCSQYNKSDDQLMKEFLEDIKLLEQN